jgi:hypothetical protein
MADGKGLLIRIVSRELPCGNHILQTSLKIVNAGKMAMLLMSHFSKRIRDLRKLHVFFRRNIAMQQIF